MVHQRVQHRLCLTTSVSRIIIHHHSDGKKGVRPMRLARRFPRLLLLLVVLLVLPRPALADKPIIVGDGTAANCTETALGDALVIAATVGGGTIKFHCGGGPVTVAVTVTLMIPDNTTVDSGGQVTLLGHDVIVAFVGDNTTAALKNLVISGEFVVPSPASHRGGVFNEGSLTVDHVTFADNRIEGLFVIEGQFVKLSALTNLGTLT
jgi:hypothetical protein